MKHVNSLDLSVTNWGEVKKHNYDMAILPWGAVEPHNYHLPYLTDSILTYEIANDCAREAPSFAGFSFCPLSMAKPGR